MKCVYATIVRICQPPWMLQQAPIRMGAVHNLSTYWARLPLVMTAGLLQQPALHLTQCSRVCAYTARNDPFLFKGIMNIIIETPAQGSHRSSCPLESNNPGLIGNQLVNEYHHQGAPWEALAGTACSKYPTLSPWRRHSSDPITSIAIVAAKTISSKFPEVPT